MSTPMGILNTFSLIDAGSDHKLVHLCVCHLHTVDTRRIVLNTPNARSNCGITDRARTTVEIAEPEPVR